MVKSPCIEICSVDPKTNLCIGCNRNIEEITNWISYSKKKRNEIIKKIKKRNYLINNSN